MGPAAASFAPRPFEPEIITTGIRYGDHFPRGSVRRFSYVCRPMRSRRLTRCRGHQGRVDTRTVGVHTFYLSARDTSGRWAIKRITYEVTFPFRWMGLRPWPATNDLTVDDLRVRFCGRKAARSQPARRAGRDPGLRLCRNGCDRWSAPRGDAAAKRPSVSAHARADLRTSEHHVSPRPEASAEHAGADRAGNVLRHRSLVERRESYHRLKVCVTRSVRSR